jgi:hypothetical protein
MATAPIYCTHKELKRVFPQLDEFDNKTPIYGFDKELDLDAGDSTTDNFDLYYSADTGLITDLFYDGSKISKITFPTSQHCLLNGAVTTSASTITVDGGHSIEVGDIIKIDSEYIYVATVSTNNLGVVRGIMNTAPVAHSDDTNVFLVIDLDSYSVTGTSASSTAIFFTYDSDMDLLLLVNDGGSGTTDDVNDHLIEAGEDFTTLVTQFRTDASRYLDSKLDPNLPKNQLKDKSGNFDYLIVRTTALLAAVFMIRATDPTSEMATAMMEEAQGNIDDLNNGKAALSHQNTADSSKGVIRDVTYTGTVRPVDTRGHYSGTYDLLKIKITTGGAIGTAKYSVWTKDGDKLGMNEGNQVVTDEIVNGDYQALAGGLQVRFEGTNFDSTATANDIWEVEVMGWSEEVDSNNLQPIRMTRRWQ